MQYVAALPFVEREAFALTTRNEMAHSQLCNQLLVRLVP